MKPVQKIALLGFGDIAKRLAKRLSQNDQYSLVGVKRSPIDEALIPIELGDCANPEDMSRVLATQYDVIVMSFTPSGRGDHAYQEAYVNTAKNIVAALDKHGHQPRLLLWVSSSSVYGQQDQQWVDEASPTVPNSVSGQRLLEAEQHIANSGYPHCIVRFSGIYGPGRSRLIDQVVAGKGSPDSPIQYTNRIHADDCAGVLAHLIYQQTPEPLYLATDCEPVPLHEVKQWIAQQLALPINHLLSDANTPVAQRGSKRCNNQKLIDSGYQFIYPSFRQGYQALLDKI